MKLDGFPNRIIPEDTDFEHKATENTEANDRVSECCSSESRLDFRQDRQCTETLGEFRYEVHGVAKVA